MTTLLVLGSKPNPVLPSHERIDEVACANASGITASALGLPRPTLTVLSSVVPSGKNPSNRLALDALAGLSTGTLHIYPRPPYDGRLWKKLRHFPTVLRTTPLLIRSILQRVDYRYDEILCRPLAYYLQVVLAQCGCDHYVYEQFLEKVPSTGIVAVALSLADRRYERVIVSGFSFEITHSYADNPEIASRGSTASRHATTDIAVLTKMAEHSDRLFTSEPIVHERAGLRLLPGAETKMTVARPRPPSLPAIGVAPVVPKATA